MVKKSIILLLLITACFVAKSTIADTIEKGYISVSMSTTKEVSPNQAEISISVETSDKSLQVASENNKTIANKVYASLKSLLGADDYIKTSNYSARPQYIYTKDNKKNLDKYLVFNRVTVKTKKLDIVSKIIDTAIANGATTVENLTFVAADYDSACNEALTDITKKAYAQAGAIAKAADSMITGVKSINATCNPDNNPRPMYAMAMKESVDNMSSTPIESGKIKVFANIDASFYVK